MKVVHGPGIWDKLSPSKTYYRTFDDPVLNGFSPSFFHSFTLFVGLIGLFMLLGLINRVYLGVSLALICYLLFEYFLVKKTVKFLEVRRKVPHKATEDEMISVEYVISHPINRGIFQVYFIDIFDGSQQKYLTHSFEVIKGGVKKRVFKQVALDTGMGVKNFGPLFLYVQDPLGLFQYVIEYQRPNSIEVFPKVEVVASIPIKTGIDTIVPGTYTFYQRGSSVNIWGVRPYQYGDAVKTINWKISSRAEKLVVNEYEINTNALVSFFFNNCKEMHVGQGRYSTWEYSKDLILGLMNMEDSRGNEIQFFSHNLALPAGYGVYDKHLLQSMMTKLELVDCPHVLEGRQKLFLDNLEHLPKNSVIYYISPFVSHPIFTDYDQYLRLLNCDFQIYYILVDALEYLFKTLEKSALLPSMIDSYKEIQDYWKDNESKLNAQGIKTIVIKVEDDHQYYSKNLYQSIQRLK